MIGPERTWRARLERHQALLVPILAAAVLVPGAWGFTLLDPWETHYAEVARRMLEDGDWIHLKWQNESFRSKPVLTFWLIAASMWLFGVARDGGYSGELVESELVIFAVRFPFILFAILGLTMLWVAVARLHSRRLAWFSTGILATTPIYALVARQAITDMPLVASLTVSLSCFALALDCGDRPMWRRGRLTSLHLFLAAFGLLVAAQAIYFGIDFQRQPFLASGARLRAAGLTVALPILAGLIAFVVWSFAARAGRTQRAVYMYWFYFFVALSVLAKGPPGIGLAGAVCFFYLLLTGKWSLLRSLQLPRGILLSALVIVPWHVCMWLRDGPGWSNEYFNHHMLKRFGQGVHGDRGTFTYFVEQIGIGMWPWSALIPVALAALLTRTQSVRARPLHATFALWAIVGFATFSLSQTKFHHYILPVVPALAVLVAFWIDDLVRTGARVRLAAVTAILLAGFVIADIVHEQKQLVELFIYRYDRPWPAEPPWQVDVGGALIALGLAGAAALATLLWTRARLPAVVALYSVAALFTLWASNRYMAVAAPHWGQRALHQIYYQKRDIHGVDIRYRSLGDLRQEWLEQTETSIRTTRSATVETGAEAHVTLHVPAGVIDGNRLKLDAVIASVEEPRLTFRITPTAEQREQLSALLEAGAEQAPTGETDRLVDADRLVAWQLNWRGENFWSSGEVFGPFEAAQTVFPKTDNRAFLTYLRDPDRAGRTYFLITEAARVVTLRRILPTAKARDSVRVLDTSNNKFTLVTFSM